MHPFSFIGIGQPESVTIKPSAVVAVDDELSAFVCWGQQRRKDWRMVQSREVSAAYANRLSGGEYSFPCPLWVRLQITLNVFSAALCHFFCSFSSSISWKKSSQTRCLVH